MTIHAVYILIATMTFFASSARGSGDFNFESLEKFYGPISESKAFVDGGTVLISQYAKIAYPDIKIRSESLVLAVHFSPYWDEEGFVADALRLHIDRERRRGSEIAFLASKQEMSHPNFKTFMTAFEDAQVIPFEGDGHRIQFFGKRVTVVGGNFTRCACNGLRGIIALSSNKLERIEFVTDAIYESPRPSVISPGQFSKFRLHNSTHSFLLKDALAEMSEADFLEYLRTDFLSADTLPCPYYKTGFVRVSKTFGYRVIRGAKFLGIIGDPTGRLLDLVF